MRNEQERIVGQVISSVFCNALIGCAARRSREV
jgi:hypothetical protein